MTEVKTVSQDWELLYDQYPKMYDRFSEAQDHENNIIKFIQERTEINDTNIIDVGSGAGRYSLPLVKLGANVTAVEPSVSLQNVHMQKIRNDKSTFDRSKLLLGKAENIPTPDNYFDTYIAVHSLTAIYNFREALTEENQNKSNDMMLDARTKAFDEIARVLKPKGSAFLISTYPNFYAGELAPVAMKDNLERWNARKERFLSWVESEYGFKTTTIFADWKFKDANEAAEIFTMIFGDEVGDEIRRTNKFLIKNKIAIQYRTY